MPNRTQSDQNDTAGRSFHSSMSSLPISAAETAQQDSIHGGSSPPYLIAKPGRDCA
jgi:hypothetical protein